MPKKRAPRAGKSRSRLQRANVARKVTDVRTKERKDPREAASPPGAGLLDGPPDATSFPVVGIGASAGGLEAFAQVLKSLPSDTGMAYVLVQHLAPKHESLLTGLLASHASMPVTEVQDGMHVTPNHVYVIPPNVNMGMINGVLHLVPRQELRGQHLPIDFFFRSLAEDIKGRAIGIILS